MSKAIWKFPFPVQDHIYLRMPKGADILHVDVQNAVPTLWALVDTTIGNEEERVFRLYGTGHPFDIADADYRYIGSFLMYDGALVFHLFEVIS